MNIVKLVTITFFTACMVANINAMDIDVSKKKVEAANKRFRSKLSQLPHHDIIENERDELENYIKANLDKLRKKQRSTDYVNLPDQARDAYENQVMAMQFERSKKIRAFNTKLDHYLMIAKALKKEYQDEKNALAQELKLLGMLHLESNEFNQIENYLDHLIKIYGRQVRD